MSYEVTIKDKDGNVISHHIKEYKRKPSKKKKRKPPDNRFKNYYYKFNDSGKEIKITLDEEEYRSLKLFIKQKNLRNKKS